MNKIFALAVFMLFVSLTRAYNSYLRHPNSFDVKNNREAIKVEGVSMNELEDIDDMFYHLPKLQDQPHKNGRK